MSQRELLPTTVKPVHYHVTLTPDLVNFVFAGTVITTLGMLIRVLISICVICSPT